MGTSHKLRGEHFISFLSYSSNIIIFAGQNRVIWECGWWCKWWDSDGGLLMAATAMLYPLLVCIKRRGSVRDDINRGTVIRSLIQMKIVSCIHSLDTPIIAL